MKLPVIHLRGQAVPDGTFQNLRGWLLWEVVPYLFGWQHRTMLVTGVPWGGSHTVGTASPRVISLDRLPHQAV